MLFFLCKSCHASGPIFHPTNNILYKEEKSGTQNRINSLRVQSLMWLEITYVGNKKVERPVDSIQVCSWNPWKMFASITEHSATLCCKLVHFLSVYVYERKLLFLGGLKVLNRFSDLRGIVLEIKRQILCSYKSPYSPKQHSTINSTHQGTLPKGMGLKILIVFAWEGGFLINKSSPS